MEINLDEGKINVKGKWLSSGELTQLIQEKMKAGDMRFADLATSLEELNSAIENSHTLDVNIIISKEEYNRLKQLGGSDDRECIRKAIMKFIAEDGSPESFQKESDQKESGRAKEKQLAVKCANCGSPIKIGKDLENNEIRCLECGARGLLKQRQ